MIGKFEFEVLTILKDQFMKICGNKPFEVNTVGRMAPKEQFYLEKLGDNLIAPFSPSVQNQYNQGGGNEPLKKMRALRSSSAMTFNIFGNDDAKILNENGVYQTYKVKFEKQHKTLKASASKAKANLDALLYNPETKQAYACEMKLAEWLFSSPSDLNVKYENVDCYDHQEAAVVFTPIAQTLRTQKASFRVYDANQVFKHTLACYNYCKEMQGTNQEITKLTLLNCVWELSNPKLFDLQQVNYHNRLNEEHKGSLDFNNLMQPVIPLFKSIGVDFDIQYISLGDFLKKLDLDQAHRDYLKRYTFN